MKTKNIVNLLVICIAILSLIAASYGLFSTGGVGEHSFKSINGANVTIYGSGLYKNDSISTASQGRAQDAVTMFLGIPLLLISLRISNKGLLKGKLLLTGTLGYFLYTYISYTFLSMYNSFFLIYVILMSMSFFAFTIMMLSFDMNNFSSMFSEKLPVKLVGGFLIFIAVVIGLMWLKIIASPLLSGTAPQQLEHYTTLTIQALDLGFVVPCSILGGVLIIKRRPLGYLLSSVLIIKCITMLTALTAMVIGQILAGVYVSTAVMIIFPLFNIIVCYPLYAILKSIRETNKKNISIS